MIKVLINLYSQPLQSLIHKNQTIVQGSNSSCQLSMESGESRTEHHQQTCQDILIKPEKLPSLFFMRETIPGGVLQETESLVETTAKRDDDDKLFIIPANSVLNRSCSEEAELPPLSLQRKDTEDLSWLQEIVAYSSVEQTGNSGAPVTEEEEIVPNNVCDNLGFDDEVDCRNQFCSYSDVRKEVPNKKKHVQIENQIISNEDKSETDNLKKDGIFHLCSKHLFLLMYIVLGLVIMILAVLNLVFGFKPLLLISLIVMVFILLVLLTD